MDACVFCNNERLRENLVHETEHFVIKVGIGLVAPGQVMIIPKQHFDCFADIPDALEDEFITLKKLVIATITKACAKPFMVEYVPPVTSIDHAHMHCIPLQAENYSVTSIMDEMVSGGNFKVESISRQQLKAFNKEEKGYCTFEENNQLYICHIKHLDPATIRENSHLSYRLFFEQQGTGGISWTKLSPEERLLDEKKIEKTKELLIPLFKAIRTSHPPSQSL